MLRWNGAFFLIFYIHGDNIVVFNYFDHNNSTVNSVLVINADFSDTGTLADLKKVETVSCESEIVKLSVITSARWHDWTQHKTLIHYLSVKLISAWVATTIY